MVVDPKVSPRHGPAEAGIAIKAVLDLHARLSSARTWSSSLTAGPAPARSSARASSKTLITQIPGCDCIGTASRVRSGQDGQDLADGAFPAYGLWQREVRLNVVVVAAAVLLLDHVPGLGQVREDAEGAAFGDVQAGRDVTQPHGGVVGDAQQDPGVVGQETPARHL